MGLKGMDNKGGGKGKKGLDARLTKFSDAQRNRSKVTAGSAKPRKKK